MSHSPGSSTGAVSIQQFGKENGISRATVYREISAGRLEARKVGRRTVITRAAGDAWLGSLPKFDAARDGIAA